MKSFIEHVREELAALSNIEPAIKNFFLSDREALIYGAGDQSRLALEFCHYFGKKVAALVISPQGRKTLLYYKDVPLYIITELPANFPKDQYDVLVAVHEKHNTEILNILNNLAFPHTFTSQNWEYINENLRNMWYDSYLTYHGAHFRYDTAEHRYVELQRTPVPWRFYFSHDMDLNKTNLIGTLSDNLLPSLFGDYAHVCEGPYEWGPITLKPRDVVFDLGANMGLFASIAASKGCEVYAFEPTPQARELMKKNLSFYEDVFIFPYAITDKCGQATLHINDISSPHKTMTLNSLYKEPENNSKKLNVDTTSLDKFVEKHHIERIDFIKADIEGAERFMLQGAQRTLARFAPKLALCTYHLPDDPEIMEKLILQANPRYNIEHKWSKLYAYCPT